MKARTLGKKEKFAAEASVDTRQVRRVSRIEPEFGAGRHGELATEFYTPDTRIGGLLALDTEEDCGKVGNGRISGRRNRFQSRLSIDTRERNSCRLPSCVC